MERVLPEGHHAVKFVAVYDNGTNSHSFALMNDSCCNQEWLLKESCARNREIVKAQNSHRTATEATEIGSDDKRKRIN